MAQIPPLPRLWCGVASAALIQHLAWDLPYAAGTALKSKKKKKNLKIVHQTIGSQGPSVEAGQSRPHKPRSGSVMGGDALKIEDLK